MGNLSSDGIGIPDSDLVSLLSLSFPHSYKPRRMAVQSGADTIIFDFLCGRLVLEATRRQAASTSVEQNQQPLSAMAAGSGFLPSGYSGRGGYPTRTRSFGRGSWGRGTRGASSSGFRGWAANGLGGVTGRCHYCNKEGHLKNECLKRKGDLQRNAEG